jgi:hypothetical protein
MDIHDKANSFENAPRNTHIHELLVTSKEDDLGGNVEKTTYMFMSHEQNAGEEILRKSGKVYTFLEKL